MLRNPNGPRRYWKLVILDKSRCCETVLHKWVLLLHLNSYKDQILIHEMFSSHEGSPPKDESPPMKENKDRPLQKFSKSETCFKKDKDVCQKEYREVRDLLTKVHKFCTVPYWQLLGFHLGCRLQISGEDAQIEAILTSYHTACLHVRILQDGKDWVFLSHSAKWKGKLLPVLAYPLFNMRHGGDTWMQTGGGVAAFKTRLHGWGGVGRRNLSAAFSTIQCSNKN